LRKGSNDGKETSIALVEKAAGHQTETGSAEGSRSAAKRDWSLDVPALRRQPHHGNLTKQNAEGNNVLFGVPRRGMSDGALACPDCGKVCVPLLGIAAMDQIRAVYGKDDAKDVAEGLHKNGNFLILRKSDASAIPFTLNDKDVH